MSKSRGTVSRRSNFERRRGLQLESLEGRRLLAVDLGNVNHNYIIAQDVNEDFRVTPLDALLVINEINRNGSRSLAVEGEDQGVNVKLDVNRDNMLTAMDVLAVINRLNGEGETGAILGYSYEVTDTSGNPITSANVGQTFRVNVFMQDLRASDVATGVFAGAQDLGVSNLDLIEFQTASTFFAGFSFGSQFVNDRGANEGGGLQLAGDSQPTVSDGQTFTLDSGSGPVTFEFDWDSAFNAGNTIVSIRNPGTGTDPLTFTEVANAMVEAINGSSLGVTAANNGQGVVGLPLDAVTFGAGTTSLTLSTVETEYVNEVKAFQNSFSSSDPTGVTRLYSIEFAASNAGTVTFTPGAPDRPGSENLVFGSDTVIPNDLIMFGTPFSLTINADPTAPTAANDTVSTPEDTALSINTAGLLTNDDITNTPATVVSVNTISGTTLGSVTGTTYTPPANFFGQDRVTYTLEDSRGLRSTATITINVTAVNDAPTAVDDTVDVGEDSSDNTLDLLLNDSAGPNEASDTLAITAVTSPSNGTVAIAADGLTVNYTPTAGFIGTDSFTYTVTDGGGLTDTATVTVEVAPLTLPSARRDTRTFAEDSTNNAINARDLLANDRINEGTTAVFVGVASQPTNGTLTVDDKGTASTSDDTLLYTPNANFFGSDSFTYTMNDTSDPQGENSVGTVAITVTAVNDPVVLVNDTATTNEDTALTIPTATLLANDSAGPGEGAQILTIGSVAAVGGGGTVVLNGSNVVYTPAANFNGTFRFTYTASDNGTPVSTGTATVTVTVNAVNDNPVINPSAPGNSVTASEDVNLVITEASLIATATPGPANESSQELSFTGVSAASSAGGTVTRAGGNITYRAPLNFNGSDTFTYTLADDAGGTATGTVTVTVNSVNDAPIAGADSETAFKGIPITIPVADLLSNDSAGPADESAQTLRITAVAATAATAGQVVLNTDGTITFTPDAEFTGETSFQYTLVDNGSNVAPNRNSSTGVVTVTVEEFQPTTISGTVWVNETQFVDGDREIGEDELRLGGVELVLSGTSLGQAVNMTTTTLADGSYSFADLGPGQYVVSFAVQAWMRDGFDAPGALGDADTVENQFTIDIAEPGGLDASGYNFSVVGVEAAYARALDILSSSFAKKHGLNSQTGAYLAIDASNNVSWSAMLQGFENVLFAEAVFDGSNLLFTIVDGSQNIYTATLAATDFVAFHPNGGEGAIVRVFGEMSDFEWVQVDRASAIEHPTYLDAVDAIFEQEQWGV